MVFSGASLYQTDRKSQWLDYINDLHHIQTIRMSNRVILSDSVSYSLHDDASALGYATCVYLCSVDQLEKAMVSLLLAKSKMALRKKPMPMPKLKLISTHLVLRLFFWWKLIMFQFSFRVLVAS